MIKASFAQHWQGTHYQKGEKMEGRTYALEALVRCGRAYIEKEDFPASKKLIAAGYDEFDNLPEDDEELLAIEGIGPATVEKIRNYTEEEGCGC